ncbi:MAG: hypothetical protein LPK02_06985 [Rhodobacterales bacterium]|nr:hypothetical protein [Rhodobacterales bacterium]
MSDDNWKHRSVKMRCGGCMWFIEKSGTLGRCRRHAPTLDGWPAVFETDWCGDHKVDETKIKPSTTDLLKASLMKAKDAIE